MAEAARAALLAQLAAARAHVLAAVDGLSPGQLRLAPAPSAWSLERLVSHLLWDDEVFWIGAVLAGEDEAIAEVRDGWASTEPAGPALLEAYRARVARNTELVAGIDLDAPPAWRPPPEVFPGPAFPTGWHLLHRVLSETDTHAGHLDLARELIDARQHLVLG